MVCCSYPFGHDGKAELGGERAHVVYSRIRSRAFKEPGQLEKCCSPALQDLIKGAPPGPSHPLGTRILG